MTEIDADLIAETENYMIWSSEVDDDTLVHIELGGISLHLMSEEWDEFVTLIKMALD